MENEDPMDVEAQTDPDEALLVYRRRLPTDPVERRQEVQRRLREQNRPNVPTGRRARAAAAAAAPQMGATADQPLLPHVFIFVYMRDNGYTTIATFDSQDPVKRTKVLQTIMHMVGIEDDNNGARLAGWLIAALIQQQVRGYVPSVIEDDIAVAYMAIPPEVGEWRHSEQTTRFGIPSATTTLISITDEL